MYDVVLVQMTNSTGNLEHQAFDLRETEVVQFFVNHLVYQVGQVNSAVLKTQENALLLVANNHVF